MQRAVVILCSALAVIACSKAEPDRPTVRDATARAIAADAAVKPPDARIAPDARVAADAALAPDARRRPPADARPASKLPARGEPCGTGDACADGLTCLRYYGIAGARGPEFTSCETPCKGGKGCPAGTACQMVADGPGQVCR